MSNRAPVDTAGPQAPPTHRARPRSGVRGCLRRYPLTCFFALAFVLSWAAWTPYILSEDGLGVLHFALPSVLGTSQLLGVIPGAYLGPVLSALVVTAVADGRPGLRAWTGRMAKWRVGWTWYVGIAVAVPSVLTLTTFLLSGRLPTTPSAVLLAAYVPGLILQILTTGIAEEPGWRDFAMPRLQRKYGPVRGTLVLGPLWGVWHLPLFWSEWGGWPGVPWDKPLEFLAITTAFSFVMTWVFNHTGQSLLLAMVLHTSVNNFFSVAWSDMFPSLSMRYTDHAFLASSVVVAVVLLVLTRGRLGCPPDAVGGATGPRWAKR